MAIKRVGILYHPMIKTAGSLAEELKDFLSGKGVVAWTCSAWEGERAKAQLDNTDLILTVGGDGTILRAAQVAVPQQIPITGVNLGRLGFMTELSPAEAREGLATLLRGGGWLDERTMLEAELKAGGKGPPLNFFALNDVVVARGMVARIVYLSVSVDGEPLATYRGDGVILATATGSTGYALAAGGPILYPRASDFLLLPIAPHLGPAYPMVLPAAALVGLRLTTTHQATLSVDGHINLPLDSDSVVNVRRSADSARFLRVHPEAGFYRTLEQKLKGRE